ncbi:hypothetical protein P5673_026573 [Acropora cervicornis]|uniref:Uncharacterized protein n=1 Tax=Acropora cervicornis TaxID=6130 RepID=A0AAD9Q0K1_ACRCE|nr:hypothetical protein P5673_026573 [Acropora cervicornis]
MKCLKRNMKLKLPVTMTIPLNSHYVWSSCGMESDDCGESEHEDNDRSTKESTATDSHTEDEIDDNTSNHVNVPSGTSVSNEPKFIVFYSKLLPIFSLFCFNCKTENPDVEMKTSGTMVTVMQSCSKCRNEYVWKSQPLVLGKYPAGNILLSFAVLVAGASISIKSSLFFQQYFIIGNLIAQNSFKKVKHLKDVVWCGDGRFDSMGHSAKYGVYTMMSTTILKIVHFEIVQDKFVLFKANETSGSTQTELEAKAVTKKLLQASNETGCEVIKFWIKGVRRHLYWCATSTMGGFGDLIVAKWKSFLRHVSNLHKDHPDPLYKECNHDDLEPRRWIRKGTAAHDKLSSIMTKTTLLGDVKKLSPEAQTSALEGFHATLNYWHPKMISFSWLGSYCRHILASLHFNENVAREDQTSRDGEIYYRVTYPKFKLGEEVVREVSVPPTYEYVETLKELLFGMTTAERNAVLSKYTSREPKPLKSQFPERKKKRDAVKTYEVNKARKETAPFPSDTCWQRSGVIPPHVSTKPSDDPSVSNCPNEPSRDSNLETELAAR